MPTPETGLYPKTGGTRAKYRCRGAILQHLPHLAQQQGSRTLQITQHHRGVALAAASGGSELLNQGSSCGGGSWPCSAGWTR